jgi:negative regulator of replication initiation
MKNLNISFDDELFMEIDKRTTPDFDHSDVIQKLLKKALLLQQSTIPCQPQQAPPRVPSSKDSLTSFVENPEYRVLSGINKYLTVLGWLNKNKPNEFVRIENYQRGNRVYFGKNQRQVEDSGENIAAKQIPGSNTWALSTLDNRTKRDLLTDVLHLCNYQPSEINVVIDTISDSGRHRSVREKRLEDYA